MIEQFGYTDGMLPVTGELGGAFAILIGIYLVLLLPVIALGVTSYVLQSLGLHRICKRRGIHHGWLSWLPIGNMWVLGSISDQYRYVVKGKICNRRKILTGLMIAIFVLGVPGETLALIAAAGTLTGHGLGTGLILILLVLVACVVSMVAAVYQYIACYDLFASSDPNNATAFLVLSILFPVTLPFFIFACRNKDLGMPPRKVPQQEMPMRPEIVTYAEQEEPVAEEADFEEPARFIPEDE